MKDMVLIFPLCVDSYINCLGLNLDTIVNLADLVSAMVSFLTIDREVPHSVYYVPLLVFLLLFVLQHEGILTRHLGAQQEVNLHV